MNAHDKEKVERFLDTYLFNGCDFDVETGVFDTSYLYSPTRDHLTPEHLVAWQFSMNITNYGDRQFKYDINYLSHHFGDSKYIINKYSNDERMTKFIDDLNFHFHENVSGAIEQRRRYCFQESRSEIVHHISRILSLGYTAEDIDVPKILNEAVIESVLEN